MRFGSKLLGSLFVLLSLSACGETVLFDRPFYLRDVEKLRVRLDRALPVLWEFSVLWNGLEWGEYDVGSALRRVIEDDPSAHLSVQYLSSDLQTDVRKVYVTWRIFEADYRLEVLAKKPEGIRIIEVLGKGRSRVNSIEASQEAIENAVLDLMRQLFAFRQSTIAP